MVFSALGVVAHRLNVPVSEAVAAGPDLVFVAIPPLFADLPGANIWAVLFFLMLICLGIDSQVIMTLLSFYLVGIACRLVAVKTCIQIFGRCCIELPNRHGLFVQMPLRNIE